MCRLDQEEKTKTFSEYQDRRRAKKGKMGGQFRTGKKTGSNTQRGQKQTRT